MATRQRCTRFHASSLTSGLIICAVIVSTEAFASNPSNAIRIDISPANGRHDHLQPEMANWEPASEQKDVFETHGITFTIQPLRVDESGLHADWWKAGLVHNTRMASDCVYVDGGDGIRLSIRGLSTGRHSLVTYHNSIWDEQTCAIDIVVNDKPMLADLKPSHRVSDDADAASAYVKFDAVAGRPVTVELRAAATDRGHENAHMLQRVILNGLELDTVDPAYKALKPMPTNNDEHVAPRPVLRWHAASSAKSHDVYLGTDFDRVAAAKPNSPEYRGRKSRAEYAIDAANTFATYYWRVDEVRPGQSPHSEQVTKGDVWQFRIRHLAFPGAEGYGRFARGGRGGRVINVTSLANNGPGSLRAAVDAEGPRTVVFDVSGRIVLQSRLIIHNPYLTIAGQTAPGKGICISNYNWGMLGAHDVIVRYMRVRPGNTAHRTLDGMGMASSDHSIIDHCSISWTEDEAFSSRAAKNITLQRTLISEALNVAGHKKYKKGTQHGYAASIGGDVGSFHHNLLAHCAGRNWSLAGGLDVAGRHTGRLDIRNNVVYNWGHRTTDGGARQVNFVNNYYKPGPASRVFHVLMPQRDLVAAFGPQDYYVAGNVMVGHYGADDRYAGVVAPRGQSINSFIVDAPFFDPHVRTESAQEAFDDVLGNVGCNVPVLDDHDGRVIEETRKGTTTYRGSITGYPGLPDSQADVGGWESYPEVHRPANWDSDGDGMPDEWEVHHGLNPNDATDGARDADGDGFTNLELYLNGLAAASRQGE